jgi:histidine ammonia-lyase
LILRQVFEHFLKRKLQVNLVGSHICSFGQPFSEAKSQHQDVAANVLSKGISGVRPILIGTLLEMLNLGVHPVVPEKDSVEASGASASLAHTATAETDRF